MVPIRLQIQKNPKCIYKIQKNFGIEKNGEISRNLRFPRFFVPASKSDTHHGWDGKTRTCGYQSQSLGPYHLATSQYRKNGLIIRICRTKVKFVSHQVLLYNKPYILNRRNHNEACDIRRLHHQSRRPVLGTAGTVRTAYGLRPNRACGHYRKKPGSRDINN